MGTIYTFYSYKGGVGRSMALANVAALLSKWGQRVLAIDWDIEAPGLEKYFQNDPSKLAASREERPGVVDIAFEFARGHKLDWRECLLQAYPFTDTVVPVSILSAGQDTPEYVERAQSLNWRALVDEMGFGAHLEQMREEWLAEFDFILVDSRTGITDIGGLCTIHLPDVLVLLFTANEQSLKGVQNVRRWAQEKYESLPFDRHPKLVCVPVPGRFERTAESDKADEWLGRFVSALAPAYNDWLPTEELPVAALQKLYIPNIPKWSYGENLPVVLQGTSDPRTIGYAYELLARLLKDGLQWEKALEEMGTGSAELTPALVNQGADAALAALGEGERSDARRVLVNLVQAAPAGQGEDTRRLGTPLSEFTDRERLVIKKLADFRLLTVGRDDSGAETVELKHETTLRHWMQLTVWLEESRDLLLWQQQMRSAASLWKASLKQPTGLLSGAALITAEKYYSVHASELSTTEEEYVKVSIERARRQRALRRGLSAVAAALILTLGLVFGISYYNEQQRIKKEQQEQLALQLAKDDTAEGERLLSSQRFVDAVDILTKAIAAKPDYAPAYLNRGIAYRNLRDNEKAGADFLKVTWISFHDSQEYQDAREYLDQMEIDLRPLGDPTPTPTPTPRAGATPGPSPSPTPTPAYSDLPPRVYIQFQQGTSNKKALDVADVLKKFQYVVARVQPVSEVPNTTQVRYYRYEDGGGADNLVSVLKGLGINNAQPRYIPGFENSSSVRPKHFEVWFGTDTVK
ncbi:MAG: KGGVGR-motif variant AAA ATPase [Pyrinomonadaceae bacterium]